MAIKSMGFEAFKRTYAKVLRGDLEAHYYAITGEKVPKSSPEKPKKKAID